MTAVYETHSEEELPALAVTLAGLLKKERFILLNGGLGSGKTTLVRHMLHALSIRDIVSSPTFSIHNTYTAEGISVLHSDLYRVESMDELEQTGFFELIENVSVAFIEWADKFPLKQMLGSYAEIHIAPDGHKRQYTLTITK